LPLERALTALTDEAEDEKAAQPDCRPARRGQRRLQLCPGAGPAPARVLPIYIAVIGAGEQSGHLGGVLERLADDLEESQALKAKLIGAALYPAIVTVMAIAIVMFPGELCGAPGGQRLCGHQTRPALPDRGHAGLERGGSPAMVGRSCCLVLIAAGGRWPLGKNPNS
jgi:hypothetical protein